MNILWRNKDGALAVTYLTEECEESPQKHAEGLMERGDIPSGYTPIAYELDEFPHHLPLEVWDYNDGKVGMHIDKAREWHKVRLRRERAPALAALDIESLRNAESGTDNAATLKAKQKLRDVTKVVDAAQNWEAMSAITVE